VEQLSHNSSNAENCSPDMSSSRRDVSMTSGEASNAAAEALNELSEKRVRNILKGMCLQIGSINDRQQCLGVYLKDSMS
jgi:hypothetical protein